MVIATSKEDLAHKMRIKQRKKDRKWRDGHSKVQLQKDDEDLDLRKWIPYAK